MSEIFGDWTFYRLFNPFNRPRHQQARTDRRRDPRLDELRRMFEELRVSLFAQ